MKVLLSNSVRLYLSAAPLLYYDEEKERLYVNDEGIIYRYDNVPLTAWYVIKSGDTGFFDQITEVMPYRIVPNLPKTKKLDSYRLPAPSVVMWKVNSSNINYIGYNADEQKLYVQFKNGETYVYYNVEPDIWRGLKLADSKASYLHWFVKINGYRYEKIGGFLLDYSDNYLSPNSGTAHPEGYLVDSNWKPTDEKRAANRGK